MKVKPEFTPLHEVLRAALTTKEAAYHLNRSEQTLRLWACKDNGPVQCRRVNGRLAWPTTEIKRLLGVEAVQ
ncbi:DNA-binding protein [Comamonas aquatica]|nr:DNA-binding protein [Comamonas aquatica]MDH1813906.1 DNA-binding protein [Comamonas aquatica]